MIYKPHLGVYALILNEDNQKILLIKKARGPYTGMWDLPGGTVEDDELIEETLTREVFEETGCEVTSFKQLQALSIKFPYADIKTGEDKILKHIGILYTANIKGTPETKGDGLDSHGAFWIELKDLNIRNASPFILKGIELI